MYFRTFELWSREYGYENLPVLAPEEIIEFQNSIQD